ncbi:MAG TPA: ABC transporter ATP-binding protein [Candidatus Cloacimonetes bacterium]|nr:ABC transporter ATP-binding protein [Candidatus Cloacimonadota bacterium]
MINLKNISKNYGENKALQNVSLKIEKGELFGLLGPNGAGKTTMINIINTFLPFDEGEIFINDLSLRDNKEKIKQKIGIIPQEIALYDELTAFENLKFWGEIYSISKPELKKRCEEILKMVGLYDRRNDPLKKYSGGMKRRINIAAGLLHNPEIILMDEPTVGVDPQSRNFIFEMIEQLNSIGKTIIFTTHYMEEAERLCKRIAIIDHGKIIALGTKEELFKLLEDENSITIKFKNSIDFKEFQKVLNEFQLTKISNNSILISGENLIGNLSGILNSIKQNEDEIEEIDFNKPNLEKLFLKLTGRELRDE